MPKLAAIMLGGWLVASASIANSAEAPFYQGKRITFLINFTAGGPTDIEGRIVARHLGKHIPGNPRIVVRNMASAGGIGQPLVCFIRKDAGGGIEDAQSLPGLDEFKAAGIRPTTSLDLRLRMALDLLGAKYRYVSGYRGTANLVAGIMQNEVQYSCGTILTFHQIIEPNLIRPGVAATLWYFPVTDADGEQVPDPRLAGIPTFIDVYESLKGSKPEGPLYEAMRLINNYSVAMQRASFVPAGTPSEAVGALRRAWEALPRDEEFVAEYTRLVKAPPDLVQATAVQAHVAAVRGIAPDTVAVIKQFLGSP